jgi:hypothetical protein
MPVEVAHNGTTTYHQGGHYFLVKDGHLWVVDGPHRDSQPVAVYAPGQWGNAVVVATQKS